MLHHRKSTNRATLANWKLSKGSRVLNGKVTFGLGLQKLKLCTGQNTVEITSCIAVGLHIYNS